MQERFKTFTVLISGISRSIHKIKSAEMAGFDLKSSHVSCLYYLYKESSLTATELAEMCAEDKANISRATKHLENSGYLVCTSKSAKRYQSPLTLTDKGAKIGKHIADAIDDILNKAGEGLSDEQRSAMYESLALIDKNLKAISKDYDNIIY